MALEELAATAAIAVALYGVLLLYTLWKIKGIRSFNYKRSFYFVFAIFCCSELGFYLTLFFQQRVTVWGYFFLDIISLLHVIIYAMVCALIFRRSLSDSLSLR
jgi:hypothetical protein